MTESSNMPSKRAAIYARTAEPSNPRRLKDQVRRCRKAIAMQSPAWSVAEACIFHDSSASGMTAARPGLDALLRKAAETPRPFDVVVVESADRIGRDLSVAFKILELCTTTTLPFLWRKAAAPRHPWWRSGDLMRDVVRGSSRPRHLKPTPYPWGQSRGFVRLGVPFHVMALRW